MLHNHRDSCISHVSRRTTHAFPRQTCDAPNAQNSPLLPDALKNENPLGIERLVNGEKTRDRVA